MGIFRNSTGLIRMLLPYKQKSMRLRRLPRALVRVDMEVRRMIQPTNSTDHIWGKDEEEFDLAWEF